MRSRMLSNTWFLMPSSQNKSNKQSMQVQSHKTKLPASSAIEKNFVKSSMHVSMHVNQLWPIFSELGLWPPWSGSILLSREGLIFPDLLHSSAWIHATLRTRETALRDLKEAIVFSGKSCNICSRLFARTTAMSGWHAHCSKASSKTDTSSCKTEKQILAWQMQHYQVYQLIMRYLWPLQNPDNKVPQNSISPLQQTFIFLVHKQVCLYRERPKMEGILSMWLIYERKVTTTKAKIDNINELQKK